MDDRKQFARKLSQLETKKVKLAIALLWYYRLNQTYEERTASELANDLHDLGFGRPNVTVLHKELAKNAMTVNGKRPKTFQLHTKYLDELDRKYEPLTSVKTIEITSSVIPFDFVRGTRSYLEQLVKQINGAYDYAWYDCCAVLIRRLMESLIIEVFIYKHKTADIKDSQGFFLFLDSLISKIRNHTQINLGRNTYSCMEKIKKVGDTAAHDRTYITQQQDIDDLKSDIRKTINELLVLANIQGRPVANGKVSETPGMRT